MSIKKHIPNTLTLLNLFCGTIAIICCLYNHYYMVPFFMSISLIADFLDGFVARVLKVKSDLGAQLDSLADMTTFGVLPSIMLFMLLNMINRTEALHFTYNKMTRNDELLFPFIALGGLIYAVFACLRLAKFNIDTRQTINFIGVPTPAAALLVVGIYANYFFKGFDLPWLYNNVAIISIAVIISLLMIAELPLFSLKGNLFSTKENKFRIVLFILVIPLLFIFKWLGLSLIIILYIILSAIQNKINPSNQ